MSFTTPKVEQNLTDNKPARQTLSGENVVCPLGFGRFRVAAQPITPVLHWRYRTTSKSSFAYASLMYELCLGPVDEIVRIYVGGKPYDGVFVRRDASPGDSFEHVIPKETPEKFTFFWGTETQSAAAITAKANALCLNPGHPEASAVHPRYKGRCVFFVEDLEMGQATSGFTPPLLTVEIEVYRRPPFTYADGHVVHGANPVGCIYEILRDQRGGLGLPDSLFDSTHWNAAAARVMTDGAAGRIGTDLFINPVIAERREASQVIADALAYLDGWLVYRDGKIWIDWYPNDGTTTSPTGLRELSEHDMIGEPELDPDGLAELATSVSVTGLDWGNADDPLCELTVDAQVPFAGTVLDAPKPYKINRPWIVTREQLQSLADLTATLKATPRLYAAASYRRESCTHPDGVTPLRPGDRFNFDYAPYGYDIVCRITERTETDDKAEVKLKFVSERGAAPQPYTPAIDPRATIELPDPQPPAHWAVAEAPPDLELPAGPSAIVLAERADSYTFAWRLHFAPTNSFPGEIILDDSQWAISGVVTTGLSNVTTPGNLVVTIASAEAADLISQGATEQENNSLLCYAGGEWLSVGTITPGGGGSYTLACLRGRLGSSTRAIGTTERVWLVYRDALPIVAHANFADVGVPFNGTTATKWFKLEAYTGTLDATITSAISVQFIDRSPGVVTALSATALPEGVKLEWIPPADTDVAVYEIFESPTTTQPADPVHFSPAPSNSYVRLGATAGDNLKFWVRTKDSGGHTSASVGPVSATVASAASPTLMYRGAFTAASLYYDNNDIQNLVSVGTTYYKVNNRSKDGQNGTSWGAPPSANWTVFTTLPKNVATGIILAEVGYFFDTVYVGDGSADKGRIMSHGVTGYGAGAAGFFLGFDGTTPKLFVGNPSGDKLTWNGSALSMTGTLSVGTGDSATLINATAIAFGTRFNIVDQSGQTTMVFQKTAGQSSGNKGFHIQADASNTILRGGDVSNAGPFSPTWSITSTTGVGMFTKVQIGSDCEFQRNTADVIGTSDSLVVGGALYVGANAVGLTSPSTNLLNVAGTVQASGLAANNAGTYEFFAGAGNVAVYVRNQLFQVRDSSNATQVQINPTSGLISTLGNVSAVGTLSGASLTTTAQATIGSYIALGSAASALINFHTDTNLYRASAAVLKTDGALHALGFGAYNAIAAYNGSPSDYFFLTGSVIGATIVKGHNFQVRNSSSTVKFEVNNTTGEIYIAGNRVVGPRGTRGSATITEVVALLDAWGAWA